jgi:hypothetical protein
MNVEDVRVSAAASGPRLDALIRLPGEPGFHLWFETEAPGADAPPYPGDVLAAALLPLAMTRREPLRIEAPVSDRLRRNLDTAQDILVRWIPGARRMDVQAHRPPAAGAMPGGRGVGAFFTGGVDSFYTLLKNLREHPAGDGALTHLVYVEGFDLHPSQRALLEQTREHLEAVARSTGRRLVWVRTNLRRLTDRRVRWDDMHGAALGAAGQAVSGVVRRVLVPSTFAYHQPRFLGSHPLLDHCWSGEGLEVVHDGAERTRGEKIAGWIASSDLALAHLRICWENRHGALNCGECDKCVRTMTALAAAGVLDRCRTFSVPLRAHNVLRMRSTRVGALMHFADNRRLLAVAPPGRRLLLVRAAVVIKLFLLRLRFAGRVLSGRTGFPF